MSADHQVRLMRRSRTLEDLGATSQDMQSLLAYNKNVFDFSDLPAQLPLRSESFAATWREYVRESESMGVAEVLKDKLVQLRFPVCDGMSDNDAYRDATRRGAIPEQQDEALQFQFERPDQLRLTLYATAAGELPVLTTSHRQDFVSVVRALTMRNEPKNVPDSMGAVMVAGLNNWDRVRRYRATWEAAQSDAVSEAKWKHEFSRIVPQKELYQDRLIILSNGPYSNVAANELGLSEDEWCQLSLRIRRDHECTHYFTRRVLRSMRNNLLDEIIADYMGIVGATGSYRPDWFLRFMGLENFPNYRRGGRLENYAGEPPFSPSVFTVLTRLAKAAAENLSEFNETQQTTWTLQDQAATILTLCSYTLEELASPGVVASMTRKQLEYQQAT